MSTAFSMLSTALGEAIEDAEGRGIKLRREHLSIEIEPLPVYSAERIKSIRQTAGVDTENLRLLLRCFLPHR